MARYRILQTPCYLEPRKAEYEVQQKQLLFWEHAGTCKTLNDAEELVRQLKDAAKNPIKRKVVKAYN